VLQGVAAGCWKCSFAVHNMGYQVCRILQSVAKGCSVLRGVVVCEVYHCGAQHGLSGMYCVAGCWSVLQGVVVCCRALQCVAGGVSLWCTTWAIRYAGCCSVLQRVVVCCGVW